jgi:hypothetical protein
MANAKIVTDGLYGGYYASYGATRSRRSFKTISGAIRHAVTKGHTVDMDDLPNPNAISITEAINIISDNGNETSVIELVGMHGCTIQGPIQGMNHILKKFGYKPVRITANRITGNGKPFVIDQDTPACCDPGTETYHSM